MPEPSTAQHGRHCVFFQNGDDCKQHRGEDQQKRGEKGRDIELGADVKEPDQTINMLMSGQVDHQLPGGAGQNQKNSNCGQCARN